jgi:hypothetical protein
MKMLEAVSNRADFLSAKRKCGSHQELTMPPL